MSKQTLQHPAHVHALCLRELNHACTEYLYCARCEGKIHGSTYCCDQCRLYLHESCADLPSEIQHPFHSQHPLVLAHNLTEKTRCSACENSSWFIFRCDRCGFNLDALCASGTWPLGKEFHTEQEEESNATVEHFFHNHPLIASHSICKSRFRCKACDCDLSGDIYGCYNCIFFMHKRCTELPREMRQHPSHSQHCLTLVFDSNYPQCDLCGRYSKSFYSCDECRFNLHTRCALSILALEDQREENGSVILHPFHEHQLSSFHLEREDEKVKCRVCDAKISGEAYGCCKCLHFLHKSCARLPTEIKHPHHKQHHLTLRARDRSLACKRCRCENSPSFFSCNTCDFHLDIECALQDLEQADSPVMELSTHDHPLKHVYFTKPKPSVSCGLCHDSIEGEAYRCFALDCGRNFHKSCAEAPSEIQHALHPGCPLNLFTANVSQDYFCSACQYRCVGHSFGCGKCKFYLDYGCAIRRPTLLHHLHEHSLIYFKSTKSLFHCNYCGHSCKIDCYRCPPCNFTIHRDCTGLLPETIKHPRHLDPLSLHDAFCDDEFGEYFCDICEKERNPGRGVYYCEPCNYVAHIECVIPVADPGAVGRKEIISELDKTIATIRGDINKQEIKLDKIKEELEELNKKLEEAERKRADLLALNKLEKQSTSVLP